MPWGVNRRGSKPEPSSSSAPGERLTDAEFLSLVRDRLGEMAPELVEDCTILGSVMVGKPGWSIVMLPNHTESRDHYDIGFIADLSVKPTRAVIDCAHGMGGTAQDAAWRAVDLWLQTAGMCALEMVDRRGKFAQHVPGNDARGVPGWYMLMSGVAAYGQSLADNERLQSWTLRNHVLHRVADALTPGLQHADLNGIKVFYGGLSGSMIAEVRVNGENDVAASAALAGLDWPVLGSFTAVRCYAVLVRSGAGHEGAGGDGSQMPDFPAVRVALGPDPSGRLPVGASTGASNAADQHGSGRCACCGEALDPDDPRFDLPLPEPVAALSEARRQATVEGTEMVLIARGIGNFIKVLLPVRLDDGRTVTYSLWVGLGAPLMEKVCDLIRAENYRNLTFEGLLANGVRPWGDTLLRAHVRVDAVSENGSWYLVVVGSDTPALAEVLAREWPADHVLGSRDLRR